ncbi:hypothetical protein AB1Y20_018260 [Prymnesium parvum]|uniref:Hexosyltransferase n=1 Tax=Prymnesium parvum TaxID=97485 RepID=A0AB34JRS1_PRYPA
MSLLALLPLLPTLLPFQNLPVTLPLPFLSLLTAVSAPSPSRRPVLPLLLLASHAPFTSANAANYRRDHRRTPAGRALKASRRAPLPPSPLPHVPFGANASAGLMEAACPSRRYARCFHEPLLARYPQHNLFDHTSPHASAAASAARLTPRCALGSEAKAHGDARPKRTANADGESFVLAALRGARSPRAAALRARLAAAPRLAGGEGLRCGSGAAALDAQTLVLLALPTTHRGEARRRAARLSWLGGAAARRRGAVVGCFVLSAQYRGGRTLDRLVGEAAAHEDMMFVDAPETKWLITNRTGYSGFRSRGRGMPTFKQFAFFRHASAMLPSVPFIGKLDDDTIPNVEQLPRLLLELRCFRYAFIGQINWAAFIPRAYRATILGDRCGFGWGVWQALQMFGSEEDTYHKLITPCDRAGAVLPFPYASGAGYIFSGPLLQWMTTSTEVEGWIAEAEGPNHEALQWQKYEDSTTGYWLSYAPAPVHYINVYRWVHDMSCRQRANDEAMQRSDLSLYRPPCNISLWVHGCKRGKDMVYAKRLMDGEKYVHKKCLKASWSIDATVKFWQSRAEKLNQDVDGKQLTPAEAKAYWARKKAKANGKDSLAT